jgi:Fe-S cluster assembly protein SufD
MSAAELTREFEARVEGLPGSPDTMRRRREALDEFARTGFPTRRDEDFRYTDLKPIASGGFAFGADGAESIDAAKTRLDRLEAREGLGARGGLGAGGARAAVRCAARLVLLDGRLEPGLSSVGAPEGTAAVRGAAGSSVPAGAGGLEGVEIVRLADDPARFGAALARRPSLDGHPLASLNTAFAADGVSIRVKRGVVVREPIYLYFLSRTPGLAEQPRIAVELEAGASLRLVVHGLDADPARPTASWRNAVVHVALGEGARLSLHRLQEYGPAFLETSLLAAELGKDAKLEAGYIDAGGRLVRNDIDVRLLAPGAEVSLFGVFVAGRGSHIDNHTKIEHVAPHTRSDEVFRGIADAGGRGVFNGKVIVHPGAQRTDARQSSDNLLLADGAEIDTKPELEIYADDVKCSHGATVGELDAEQLFYLRARGIDEPAARALLTFAFANTVLARVEPAELRARATAQVGDRLPGGATAEHDAASARTAAAGAAEELP